MPALPRRWLLSALLGAAAALAGCGDAAPSGGGTGGRLKVGVVLPMSGDHATFGEEAWNAMQLALDDLKTKGSPKAGWDLTLKDEQSKPEAGGTQAKALINTAGVHVVVGSVTSGVTRKVFQECKEAGVPGLSPGATNDQITVEGGPYTSRICFKDGFQGPALARFALGEGWRKVAVVEDKSAPYATGLSESFRRAFEAAGGSVSREYYKGGDADYSNLVQNVVKLAPDVIFIAGYYGDAGLMLKQAQGAWGVVPVIGGDGLDSPELMALAGNPRNPIYFTTHFAADDPNPLVQSFTKRYRERFGKAPGAMAAVGYDALLVLADAADRCADPTDRKALAEAIAATQGVKGVTGEISLTTPDRTPRKALVVVKLAGAGFTFVKTITPE